MGGTRRGLGMTRRRRRRKRRGKSMARSGEKLQNLPKIFLTTFQRKRRHGGRRRRGGRGRERRIRGRGKGRSGKSGSSGGGGKERMEKEGRIPSILSTNFFHFFVPSKR